MRDPRVQTRQLAHAAHRFIQHVEGRGGKTTHLPDVCSSLHSHELTRNGVVIQLLEGLVQHDGRQRRHVYPSSQPQTTTLQHGMTHIPEGVAAHAIRRQGCERHQVCSVIPSLHTHSSSPEWTPRSRS